MGGFLLLVFRDDDLIKINAKMLASPVSVTIHPSASEPTMAPQRYFTPLKDFTFSHLFLLVLWLVQKHLTYSAGIWGVSDFILDSFLV